MELEIYHPTMEVMPNEMHNFQQTKKAKPFIEANTIDVGLDHLQHECIIPVFAKDNERTISHQEFINSAIDAATYVFGRNSTSLPEIRVSHTIKGRTPDAIHKAANELLEHEKTIYYERMAFAFEVKGITHEVGGNLLTLTIGGVRAYNHENLFNKKGLEHFKFFIGFKNMVCCNMCISSDGFVEDLRASSLEQLTMKMMSVIQEYRMDKHLEHMNNLTNYSISESQFAQILGKCRLHQYLPKEQKQFVPQLHFNDTQINSVARDYFDDKSFARNANGKIDLWRMYNLFTGANKSSYIDMFIQRNVNAFELSGGIADALINEHSDYRWFVK
jgi:hypothetical protein